MSRGYSRCRRGAIALKRNTPPWLDGELHSPLKTRVRCTSHVCVIRIVVDSDVSGELEVTPLRRSAHSHPGHSHDHTAEHSRRAGVICRLREGNVVAALTLAP